MKHVVLLRAINVAGRNKIKMAELRDALTGIGFENVETYIQSGNIIFDSPETSPVVADKVRTVLTEDFGLEVPVVTRTAKQWKAAIAANQHPNRVDEPKRLLVYFCDAKPKAADFSDHDPDELVANGKELYVWYGNDIARSKLTVKLIEKRTGVTATARNWSTLLKIADMLG